MQCVPANDRSCNNFLKDQFRPDSAFANQPDAEKGLDRVANADLSETNLNHIFHLLGITEEDSKEAISCETLLGSSWTVHFDLN